MRPQEKRLALPEKVSVVVLMVGGVGDPVKTAGILSDIGSFVGKYTEPVTNAVKSNARLGRQLNTPGLMARYKRLYGRRAILGNARMQGVAKLVGTGATVAAGTPLAKNLFGRAVKRFSKTPATGLKLLVKRNPLGVALGAGIGGLAVGSSLSKKTAALLLQDAAYASELTQILVKEAMTADSTLQNAFFPHNATGLLERTNPQTADALPDFTSSATGLAREAEDVTARRLLPLATKDISVNRRVMQKHLKGFRKARSSSVSLG